MAFVESHFGIGSFFESDHDIALPRPNLDLSPGKHK
jgi:hypothetical protein